MAGDKYAANTRRTDRGEENMNLEKTRYFCLVHTSDTSTSHWPSVRPGACTITTNTDGHFERRDNVVNHYLYTRVAGNLNLHNFSKRCSENRDEPMLSIFLRTILTCFNLIECLGLNALNVVK